ncbi:CpaF family protein [Clostridiales bacterium F-3ap]|uniref:CpaF family protein n=2 Tax=Anaerotalea alkaliphila TaxID=2662126 RepID=A0A7X5KNE9_9FIRM|nr:CpaF family protein [Anaerotalea alkaliphila]
MKKSPAWEQVQAMVYESLNRQRGTPPDDTHVAGLIDASIQEWRGTEPVTLDERIGIFSGIFNSLRRLDLLQPLLDDDAVTEIMVNGPSEIFVEKDGRMYREEVEFDNKEKLEDLIQRIVSRVNRVVNEKNPICDARLEDGSRVNIVLPPAALDGPVVTIRKFPDNPLTMERLVEKGTLERDAAVFLERMVKAKYNIFISGGTGTGKTTFLNVLSNFIPSDERIITIEDSAELQIRQIRNLVRLETRNENLTGTGGITIRDLIKTSLRMRPDRIVVGEVRGEEALDMLQAMNTGHDGSLSTGHANSARDMLNRLETMILAAARMSSTAIRQQIVSGIDLVVHLERMGDHSRKVMEIVEVVDLREDRIQLHPLYLYREGKLTRTDEPMCRTRKLEKAGLHEG